MKPTQENTGEPVPSLSLTTGSAFCGHPATPPFNVESISDRLEALRLKLCAVGLHPGYHDTPEKAADAVVEMIACFRAELANPPADVCGLVMEKYGVEGFTGDKPARCRLVSLPNTQGSETPARGRSL